MRAILLATALWLCATAAQANGRWTWTLYEAPGSLALANEIPDTDSLAAVVECRPGSGLAKVSIFPGARSDKPVTAEYRTVEPAFAAFVKSGKLSLQVEGGTGAIAMDAEHRQKLERFAMLCGA